MVKHFFLAVVVWVPSSAVVMETSGLEKLELGLQWSGNGEEKPVFT